MSVEHLLDQAQNASRAIEFYEQMMRNAAEDRRVAIRSLCTQLGIRESSELLGVSVARVRKLMGEARIDQLI
jgi:hypothetical protein